MLKSNLLKLRISPDKSITPIYVRENNYELRKRASAISEIFANSIGRARKELDEQTSRFRKGTEYFPSRPFSRKWTSSPASF